MRTTGAEGRTGAAAAGRAARPLLDGLAAPQEEAPRRAPGWTRGLHIAVLRRPKLCAMLLYSLWSACWLVVFTLPAGRLTLPADPSRAAGLAAAMAVVLLCPLIARRQFRHFRRGTAVWNQALFRSALWTSALWVAFWSLFIALIKLRALRGADAMRVGVDLALCFGALFSVNLALGAAMILNRGRSPR
jgi:hypothetical protein